MNKSLIVILSLLFLGSCGRKKEAEQPAVALERIIPVKVTTVQEMQLAEITEIIGEIQASYQVDIFPKINGLVIQEHASLGQTVRKGDVLAELDQDIPGMDYAPVKLETTTAGTITRDEVEVGARVSPQRAVYTISQLNPILFVAKATESLLGQIKNNDRVTVQLDAFPTDIFRGRIIEISPVVDPMTRTATLKIALNNPTLRLKPGMFGRVEIKSGKHIGLIVPIDALVRSGANQYIYLIKNKKARRVLVKTGSSQENQIEVRGELQAGDTVVVLGQNLLEDDTRVKIVTDF